MKRVSHSVAIALSIATATVLVAVPGTALAQEDTGSGGCPTLMALGVQGTGESSPGASPTNDTGMLSDVFRPFLAGAQTAGIDVGREYVPYAAGYGGFVAGGAESYQVSVTGGGDRLSQTLSDKAAQCPNTLFALVGYSQGSHVVSKVAHAIGQGNGPVSADRVAAVAMFADPTRAEGAQTFPGASQNVPSAAPGTSGDAVAALGAVTQSGATGGGISPDADKKPSFGALTGRVASFCSAGDLACDAPQKAPLMQAVANISGQAEFGGDPLRALASIGQALALTGIKTATKVVNEDVSGNSLSNLSISPKKSLSARIAEASNPTTELDAGAAIQALFKVATIGVNSAITVAKTVLTPSNIAEIAAAGLSNPIGALAVFGTKLIGALPQLVPPATQSRLVQQTFTAFTDNIKDNSDLLNATNWVKYSQVLQQHGSYSNDSATGGGKPAVGYVADWLTAVAKDAAGVPATGPSDSGQSHPKPDISTPASSTTAKPTTSKPSKPSQSSGASSTSSPN
ncbi:cutinase family protein [Nocardia salmonicida]|uniref:cutinase family protein n=1 Tax=Nocardia salmonicida TaxID=53431 RepID=UPI0037ACB2BC